MVRSTAAIDEQRVFFTSDDGYLYAISQKNGQLAWKTSLNDADAIRIEPAKGAPYRYDYGKSSPIVVDDTIYVGSADQHLYAIAKDTGSIKWKFKTNDFIRATPVYHNGVVYVGSLDNNLYAVDANSGSKNWDFSAYNVIVSAAAIIEDKIIVGSRDAYIYALDPQSGDVEWTYYFNDRSWVESTAIQGQEKGVFYIGTSDSKKLMKFDLKTGKEIWSAPTLGWTWPLPFIHEKTVYIGSMGAKGYWNDVNPGFIGVDTETGELKYQYTPQLLPGYVTGGVFGSPAVYNNKLYVPDLDGKIREFNL
jgi:outer membrane protein assembly factor BamB